MGILDKFTASFSSIFPTFVFFRKTLTFSWENGIIYKIMGMFPISQHEM